MPMPDSFGRRIENAAASLGEHFDSVLIVATRQHEGRTFTNSSHRGNYHACSGSARHWLARADERSRDAVRHEGD